MTRLSSGQANLDDSRFLKELTVATTTVGRFLYGWREVVLEWGTFMERPTILAMLRSETSSMFTIYMQHCCTAWAWTIDYLRILTRAVTPVSRMRTLPKPPL